MNIDHPYILDILYSYYYVFKQVQIVDRGGGAVDERVCLASGRLGVRIYILFKIKSTNHKFLTYHKRSDQVIISRILIGYSKLTHTYVFKGEQQPECIFYYCTSTLDHTFLQCSDTLPARPYFLII